VQVSVISVGRPRGAWRELIEAYDGRASRYWKLVRYEVKEESGRRPVADVLREEGERIMGRVPAGAGVVALTRTGEMWSSEALADHLRALMTEGHAGPAFLIGGAHGLASAVLSSGRQLSLSPLTLPHEMALALLLEQLYRAGTILRGEPYHKAGDVNDPRRAGR
jgi:23S rRNA (pseudouridine1915-N3)-methyltransferase